MPKFTTTSLRLGKIEKTDALRFMAKREHRRDRIDGSFHAMFLLCHESNSFLYLILATMLLLEQREAVRAPERRELGQRALVWAYFALGAALRSPLAKPPPGAMAA